MNEAKEFHESPDYRSTPTLHIHMAAMAPHFMDVRTILPWQSLKGAPEIHASYSHQKIELPRLPAAQPKLVVVQRIGVPDLDRYKTSVRTMIEKGWIIVTELDDHPDLINLVHNRQSSDVLWRGIRLSHAVQTSTLDLAEAFRSYNPEVVAFPNAAFKLGRRPLLKAPDSKLRIFYGALNRERFSARIGAALAEFALRRREATFVVVNDRAFFEGLGSCSKIFHKALPYDQYLSAMESCDIALMPLEGSVGELYKSDVKFVEASSLGLVSLASPPVYAKTIQDGFNGVIVPDIEGWGPALERLVCDSALRERLSVAAYDYVANHRVFSLQIEQRIAWYRDLWDRRVALTSSLSQRFHALKI